MRIARAVAVVGALSVAAVLLWASPASAHGVGGIQPSNLETRVLSIRPHPAGIAVRSVDLGAELELRNTTTDDVIVIGYNDEPYLRVGPRGTFENVRSPAVYLNKTRYATTKPPPRADAEATPRWRKVSDSTTARWHDHRAHWMGRDDPPVAQRDPGSRHLVQRFTIQMYEGDRLFRVRGDVVWEPGPSPWPWALCALALMAAVLVASGTRHARVVVMTALSVMIVSETAHIAGTWGATTASGLSQLASSLYSLGGVALCVIALVWTARRGLYAAAPLVLLAGLFVAIAGGLADVNALSHSQLPTNSPHWLARLEVTLALGLGTGVAIVAGLLLRPGAGRSRLKRVEIARAS